MSKEDVVDLHRRDRDKAEPPDLLGLLRRDGERRSEDDQGKGHEESNGAALHSGVLPHTYVYSPGWAEVLIPPAIQER